jgi:hypothetical protein
MHGLNFILTCCGKEVEEGYTTFLAGKEGLYSIRHNTRMTIGWEGRAVTVYVLRRKDEAGEARRGNLVGICHVNVKL